MKLRIKGNSIRFRLGQSEVSRLGSGRTIQEVTAFGPSDEQRLSCILQTCDEAPDVDATFANGCVLVRVPSNVARGWATTDQVGIHASQPTGNGGELGILIEKDFECIDAPPDESQGDAFPNPQRDAACGTTSN
jgi:hypothetical protein